MHSYHYQELLLFLSHKYAGSTIYFSQISIHRSQFVINVDSVAHCTLVQCRPPSDTAPFFHKSQSTDLNLLSMSTPSHTAPWFNVDHRRTLHLSFTNLNPPISICYQCRPRRTLHLGSMSTTVRHCTFLSVVKYQQHQFEPRWLVLNFIFTRPRATFNPNRRTRFQLVLFRVR